MSIRRGIVAALLAIGATAIPVAGHAARVVEINVAPPPDVVEVVPAPRPGYVWAPGYHRWDHGHHVWVKGHWIRERHGHEWVPHHWEQHGDRWRFEEGHWR
jgi:YXWGXW repeat-containing protein